MNDALTDAEILAAIREIVEEYDGVVPHQATAALRDMLAAFNQQETP